MFFPGFIEKNKNRRKKFNIMRRYCGHANKQYACTFKKWKNLFKRDHGRNLIFLLI